LRDRETEQIEKSVMEREREREKYRGRHRERDKQRKREWKARETVNRERERKKRRNMGETNMRKQGKQRVLEKPIDNLVQRRRHSRST